MMRQAGRYQTGYMDMKEKFTFEQMCKLPKLASEVAMLPIRQFDFDIAILFSDILWHLEGLGFPLKFDPGPKFETHLNEENWEQYVDVGRALKHINFQSNAIEATREALPFKKSLIGFVGGPWSLLNYALGSNKVSNEFKSVYLRTVLIPLIKDSIRAQKLAGAEVVMILDSGLENVSKNYYDNTYLPMLESITDIGNVGYYVRGIPKNSLSKVKKMNWAGIGIDSSLDLSKTLKTYTKGFVQGNFDEKHMLLDTRLYHYELDKWLESLEGVDTTGWVCGLGHGITKTTPTEHVEHFVKTVREKFS